jgi:hypothetical protein
MAPPGMPAPPSVETPDHTMHRPAVCPWVAQPGAHSQEHSMPYRPAGLQAGPHCPALLRARLPPYPLGARAPTPPAPSMLLGAASCNANIICFANWRHTLSTATPTCLLCRAQRHDTPGPWTINRPSNMHHQSYRLQSSARHQPWCNRPRRAGCCCMPARGCPNMPVAAASAFCRKRRVCTRICQQAYTWCLG